VAASKSIKGTFLPTERQEQDKVLAWARLMVSTGQEPRLRLLRCGFEGIRLSMGTRMQMKRQSVSRGFPDLVLYIPRRRFNEPDYYALFIELKRQKNGSVSQEQAEMIGLLQDQGYKAIVCRGADHAIQTIKEYLGINY
jgi:hypothetical protein